MDVVSFLQKYGISHELNGKNTGKGWVGVNCPFCGDHGYHGGFNLQSGGWSCWKCGRSRKQSTKNAIKQLTGVPWGEVQEILEEFFRGFGTGYRGEDHVEKKPFFLPGSPDFKRGTIKYISDRKYNIDLLRGKYGALCGGYDGDYSYRVIVPIKYQGRIVSFQSRDTTNFQKIRYRDCPKDTAVIYHKNILYNLDNCKENWCLVVEGVFDVWRLGDNCCCTFGTGYTQAQVVLLSDLFDKVFVWYDPEAEHKAQELCMDLKALGTFAEVLMIDAPEDPGETAQGDADYIMQMVRERAV